jgi:hypothetical protein
MSFRFMYPVLLVFTAVSIKPSRPPPLRGRGTRVQSNPLRTNFNKPTTRRTVIILSEKAEEYDGQNPIRF